MMKLIRIAAILSLSLLTACVNVKPWERRDLSRAEMSFIVDPMDKTIQDHIHHSKEGSASVVAGSGGGCGCN